MNPFNLRAFIPKEALPLAPVVTLSVRNKRFPSPKPEGSAAEFVKSWMVKVSPGVELRVPRTMERPVEREVVAAGYGGIVLEVVGADKVLIACIVGGGSVVVVVQAQVYTQFAVAVDGVVHDDVAGVPLPEDRYSVSSVKGDGVVERDDVHRPARCAR